MKWEDFRRSDNVEDRTDMSPAGGFGGGGIRLGGGALIVIVVVSLLFGVNPLTLLGDLQSGGSAPPAPTQPEPGYGPQRSSPAPGGAAPPLRAPQDPQKEFSARILGDTEDVWGAIFQASGSRYVAPKLVLFRGAVQSACGRASAAVGPFYCSQDRAVYLDTAFFSELSRRFKAPGDFAQAYVIAHEIGHHVQNLTGTMQKVDAQMQRQDERGRNALSVRLELQADCYAGVWANHATTVPDASGQVLVTEVTDADLKNAVDTAATIGDDYIQTNIAGQQVDSSQFSHGTSAQRQQWLLTGYQSGNPASCNTFDTNSLG
jgi:predicted metalloprotease